jgi:hypothetical protein
MTTTTIDITDVNPKEVVSSLIYVNYKHNRTISPEVTPEQWEPVYGPKATQRMEAQLQAELFREELSAPSEEPDEDKESWEGRYGQ